MEQKTELAINILEGESSSINNFDFACCLFGIMKLRGIEKFNAEILSNYISTLFASSNSLRKYFPNVDGDFTILETISLLKLDNEIKIGKKYNRLSFDKEQAYEFRGYVNVTVEDQRLNMIISDIVTNYIINQKLFNKYAIDSTLVKVNKTK